MNCVTPIKKLCPRCGETKSLESFYKLKDKKYLSGRSPWCKSCCSKSACEYQKTSTGKINKNRNNAKYKKSPKGKLSEQRYKNGSAGMAAKRRYNNSIAGHAAQARWRNNRRLRSINLINDLTAMEWEEILVQQNYRCKICDVEFDNNIMKRAERDHIIPLMYGGALTKSNVQALCRSCNARKSASIKIPQINTQTHFEIIPH